MRRWRPSAESTVSDPSRNWKQLEQDFSMNKEFFQSKHYEQREVQM